jgi:hypothetical protein
MCSAPGTGPACRAPGCSFPRVATVPERRKGCRLPFRDCPSGRPGSACRQREPESIWPARLFWAYFTRRQMWDPAPPWPVRSAGTSRRERSAARPSGDIVILASPYAAAPPILRRYGNALAGKVIVDITDPCDRAESPPTELLTPDDRSDLARSWAGARRPLPGWHGDASVVRTAQPTRADLCGEGCSPAGLRRQVGCAGEARFLALVVPCPRES